MGKLRLRKLRYLPQIIQVTNVRSRVIGPSSCVWSTQQAALCRFPLPQLYLSFLIDYFNPSNFCYPFMTLLSNRTSSKTLPLLSLSHFYFSLHLPRFWKQHWAGDGKIVSTRKSRRTAETSERTECKQEGAFCEQPCLEGSWRMFSVGMSAGWVPRGFYGGTSVTFSVSLTCHEAQDTSSPQMLP